MYLALETNQWVAILVGVACLGALVVIVVAPWRRIRSEPGIRGDVEKLRAVEAALLGVSSRRR